MNTFEDLMREFSDKKSGIKINAVSGDSPEDLLKSIKNIFSKEEKFKEQEEEETNNFRHSNFDNFEETLKNKNGIFDYTSFTVNNKKFDVKYWANTEEEEIVIKEESKSSATELDELDELLNITSEFLVLKKEIDSLLKNDKLQEAAEVLKKIKNLQNRFRKN